MLTATNITAAQIQALRTEAGQVGDRKMIAICDRALAGSMRARRIVARAIREAHPVRWEVLGKEACVDRTFATKKAAAEAGRWHFGRNFKLVRVDADGNHID